MSAITKKRATTTKARFTGNHSNKRVNGQHVRAKAASQNSTALMGLDPLNPGLHQEGINSRGGANSYHCQAARSKKGFGIRRGTSQVSHTGIYPIVEIAGNQENIVETNLMTFDDSFVKSSQAKKESSSSKRVAFSDPPKKKERDDVLHENITWYDAQVISYCLSNRVMYIMRGLPGSGKSTIAKRIQQLYPKKSAVICSADDFRYSKDGTYVFSPETLHKSHNQCEQKAQLVCSKGAHIVIIDNTNIKFGDVLSYLNLAMKYGYIVNFIATDNGTSTSDLAIRNIHGVPEEVITRMKSQYIEFLPYYYGWEVSRSDTMQVKDTFRNLFRALINVPLFKTFALRHASRGAQFDPKHIFQVYSMKVATSSSTSCHVTSCFTNKGKVRNSKTYSNNAIVNRSIGAVQHIKIIGWCVTLRTIFARVQLNNEQKQLWGRNDAFNGERTRLGIETSSWLKKNTKERSASATSSDSTEFADSFAEIDLQPTDYPLKIAEFIQNIDESYILPDFGVGSTAHITLGIADGGKSVDAKRDLDDILKAELDGNINREWNLPQYLLRCYGNSSWVVYLKSPVFLPAMFSATYCHK